MYRILVILISAILFFISPQNFLILEASVTVSPVTGGSSLRFGRADVSSGVGKEVRIRTNSASGKQYQVFQRLLEPLTNERGERLAPQVLRFNAIIGSNAAGTLYAQNLDSIGIADHLIYSSAANGANDAFSLVYQIDNKQMSASGQFQGKLLLTLRSVDGSSPEEVFLDIFVDAVAENIINIQSEQGNNLLRIGTDNLPKRTSGNVRIDAQGYVGQTVKIYQEILLSPKKDTGEEVDARAIQVHVSDSQGRASANPIPLSLKRQLLYEGSITDEKIELKYDFVEEMIVSLYAGRYVGKLQYLVDDGVSEKIFPFDFEVNVSPVFEVVLAFPDGNVSFSQVLPLSPPQIKQVEVTVKSNSGKPYVVTEELKAKMANAKGEELDHAYFTMKGEIPDGEKGKLESLEYVPVPVGTTPIFYSDRKGSPAKFRIFYRLTPYQGMPSGDFSTAVVFSLSEM